MAYQPTGPMSALVAFSDFVEILATSPLVRTPCKKCISIMYVMTNKSVVKYFRILSPFTTAILA
jgi:hypothetical protein